MNRPVVGTRPWLPGPLGRWSWFTDSIPAERMAAMRIASGLVLLFDVLLFYLPMSAQLYGPGSLAEPDVFAHRFQGPRWSWSAFRWLPSDWALPVCLTIWIAAAGLLTIGCWPRPMAVLLWAMSLSFYNTNYYLHNSGDRVRHFLCLMLIVAPTSAAWSARRRPRAAEPVNVPAWPVRLIVLQLALMYFMNGFYKLQDRMWWEGSVMWYVSHDLTWARWSALPAPYWVSQALTWAALVWEVGFILWVAMPRTRTLALLFGVVFHLFTFFHLDIAAFPLYALCLYVPLAPWERLIRRRSVAIQ